MENETKNHLVSLSSTSSSIQKHTQNTTDHAQANIIMALNALDSIYKSNITSYADSIHDCSRQIDDAKNRLEILHKDIQPETEKLQELQKDIDYELRTLERFTQEWNEFYTVITALKEELSELNHSEEECNTVLKGRKNALLKLQQDIDNTELKLLEYALEKQNIVLLIKPTESEITALELRIKNLENHKRYIESSHLHKISPSGQAVSPKTISSDSQILDV